MGLRLFGRWAGVEAALGVADWAAEEEDAAVFAFVLFVDVEVVFAFGLVAVAAAAESSASQRSSTAQPLTAATVRSMCQVYGAERRRSWKSDSTSRRSGAQAAMSSRCARERPLIAVESERNAFGCFFCLSRGEMVGGEGYARE